MKYLYFSTHFPALSLIILLLSPCPAQAADQDEQFRFAMNAYDAGDYQEAVKRFRTLINADPPVITKRSLLIDAHLYLGVSLLFTGNITGGEKEFEKLLTLDPDYRLDSVLFPVEIIDTFTVVTNRMKEKLARLAEERQKAEEAARRRELLAREEELRKLEKYYRHEVEHSSIVLAVLPFGIGQFQNRHKTKAYILLITEVALLAGATVTYILHEDLRNADMNALTDEDRNDFEFYDEIYTYTNWSCLATAGALMIYGLVDSLIYYRPTIQKLERIQVDEVPDHLRKKKAPLSFTPVISPLGAGAVIRF